MPKRTSTLKTDETASPRTADIHALWAAIDGAYAILCAGKPPYSAREANARKRLQHIGAKIEKTKLKQDSAVASGHSPNVEQLPGFLSRCDSSYDYGETPCNGIWWEDGHMTGGCGDACSFVMQKAGCGVPPFLSDEELLIQLHKLMLRKSRGWY